MNKAFPKYRREVLQQIELEKKGYKNQSRLTLPQYSEHMGMWEEALLNPNVYSFILPPNGEIVKHTTPASITFDDLKLPFDKCVFEFEVHPGYYKDGTDLKGHTIYERPTATMLLVEKIEDELQLVPMWNLKTRPDKTVNGETHNWSPSMFGIKLNRKSRIQIEDTGYVRVTDSVPVICSEEVHARIRQGLMTVSDLMKNLIDEIRVLAHFTMLCGCDNVNAKKIHTADAKLVKKAAKHGGIPHNDYWVLDVYMNDDHESSGSGEGGSHSSPRFHVRRGHIRRYQTGKTTWVRQCVVGTPELGIIQKDYRVLA